MNLRLQLRLGQDPGVLAVEVAAQGLELLAPGGRQDDAVLQPPLPGPLQGLLPDQAAEMAHVAGHRHQLRPGQDLHIGMA